MTDANEKQFEKWWLESEVERRLKRGLNSYGVSQMKVLLSECWATAQSEKQADTSKTEGRY